jgi:hypothetical protein
MRFVIRQVLNQRVAETSLWPPLSELKAAESQEDAVTYSLDARDTTSAAHNLVKATIPVRQAML